MKKNQRCLGERVLGEINVKKEKNPSKYVKTKGKTQMYVSISMCGFGLWLVFFCIDNFFRWLLKLCFL